MHESGHAGDAAGRRIGGRDPDQPDQGESRFPFRLGAAESCHRQRGIRRIAVSVACCVWRAKPDRRWPLIGWGMVHAGTLLYVGRVHAPLVAALRPRAGAPGPLRSPLAQRGPDVPCRVSAATRSTHPRRPALSPPRRRHRRDAWPGHLHRRSSGPSAWECLHRARCSSFFAGSGSLPPRTAAM